jgi:hypothetical protein
VSFQFSHEGLASLEVDRTPHEIFVEMDELCGQEWQEQARWIKFEEDLLEGADRWGRAHISSLTFHSLINLRLVLERCKSKARIKSSPAIDKIPPKHSLVPKDPGVCLFD